MKIFKLDPRNPVKLGAEASRRLDELPIDYSDIPPLSDEFFARTRTPWPPSKAQLTIRLDSDVLAWLRDSGRGYQTRINHILRAARPSLLTQHLNPSL